MVVSVQKPSQIGSVKISKDTLKAIYALECTQAAILVEIITHSMHIWNKKEKKQSSFMRKSIVPPAKTQQEFVT
jgi:hypothetical protein